MAPFMIIYIYNNKKRKKKVIKAGLFQKWIKKNKKLKQPQKELKKFMKV